MNRSLTQLVTALAATSALVAPTAAEAKKKTPPPAPVVQQVRSTFFTHPAGPAAAELLVQRLRESPIDGFVSGPSLVPQVEAAIASGRAGDAWAKANADKVIGAALAAYVSTFYQPIPGVEYGDPAMRPRVPSQDLLMARVSGADDPVAMINTLTTPNPVYGSFRSKLVAQARSTGALPKSALDSLARLRPLPSKGRFVMVDVVSARLWMYNNGQIEDQMKLVVGQPKTQPVLLETPMMISTISYATLNPYWHVPDHLAKKNISARYLAPGPGGGKAYLKSKGYEVVTDWNGPAIDPATVDWKGVQAGKVKVMVRQLPGKLNFMGNFKFAFPNGSDVYLHDSPERELFAKTNRHLSNGCIRLEDARRFNRWLFQGNPVEVSGDAPEQHVKLPQSVPLFVTYLPVQEDNGAVIQLTDVYGIDSLVPVPLALGTGVPAASAAAAGSAAGTQ